MLTVFHLVDLHVVIIHLMFIAVQKGLYILQAHAAVMIFYDVTVLDAVNLADP